MTDNKQENTINKTIYEVFDKLKTARMRYRGSDVYTEERRDVWHVPRRSGDQI